MHLLAASGSSGTSVIVIIVVVVVIVVGGLGLATRAGRHSGEKQGDRDFRRAYGKDHRKRREDRDK